MKILSCLKTRRRSPRGFSPLLLAALLAGSGFALRSSAANYTWTTYAGGNGFGHTDGHRTTAKFANPRGIAVDSQGNVFVAQDSSIRKIAPDGQVKLFAGIGLFGFSPWAVAVGSDGFVYATAPLDHLLYKFSPQGAVVRSKQVGFAGRGLVLDPSGTFYIVSAAAPGVNPMIKRTTFDENALVDNFAGRFQEFFTLDGLARDSGGNLYSAGNVISLITPNAAISTAVSEGGTGVAVDAAGNLYVTSGHRIRLATRQQDGTFVLSTIGGSTSGMSQGVGTAAQFNGPAGIAVTPNGTIYVADLLNHRIVKGEIGTGPDLTAITPVLARVGQKTDITLSAYGTGFVPGATILWKQSVLPTTFISDSELRATVPAAFLATTGPADISVRNPDLIVSMSHTFLVSPLTTFAYNQAVSTYVDTGIPITLTGESATPDASLSYNVTLNPSHGSVFFFGDPPGLVAYIPDPGYTGNDSFQFAVRDGAAVSPAAIVSIRVVPPTQEIQAQTTVAPGETARVSIPPTADKVGVTGTFSKNSSGNSASVMVQSYVANPTGTAVGGPGTQFIDMQVLGGITGDSLTANVRLPLSPWLDPNYSPAGGVGGVMVWYDPNGDPITDPENQHVGREGSYRRVLGKRPGSSAPTIVTVPSAPGGEVTTTFDGDTSPTICGCLANSFSGTVFAIATIAPPTPAVNLWGTVANKPISVPVKKLIAGASSSTVGPLSVTAVNSPSTAGGTVSLTRGVITYTPPPNGFFGSDSFTYTLSDDFASAQATVQVTVRSSDEQSQNRASISFNGPCASVEFLGIPGVKYAVQFGPTVSGPWTDAVADTTASPTGLISFTDCASATTRFYRTKLVE